MTRKSFRLELLKLTYRPLPQGAAEQAISDAQKLEDYIFKSSAEDEPTETPEIPKVVPVEPVKYPTAPEKPASSKTRKKGDTSIFE